MDKVTTAQIHPEIACSKLLRTEKLPTSKSCRQFFGISSPPEGRSLFVHVGKLQLNNRIDWIKFLSDWIKFLSLNCEHRQIIPTAKSCRIFLSACPHPRGVVSIYACNRIVVMSMAVFFIKSRRQNITHRKMSTAKPLSAFFRHILTPRGAVSVCACRQITAK